MIRKVEEGGHAPAARAAGLSAYTLPVAIIAGAVAGFVLSLPVTPVFVADARILVGGNGQMPGGYEAFSAGVVESEVAILKSRELASQMIRRQDLARELDSGAGPSLIDTVLIASGLKANPSSTSIEQRALDALEDRLDVAPVGNSRVIDIRYSGADPVLAAKVVNGIVDSYVNDQTMASERTGQASQQWLQGEIEMLRERVGEAERRLERHRAGSGLFNGSGGGRRADMASQELSELNAELVRAKAAHAQALARTNVVKQILKQGSSVEAAREVLDSVLIQRLREQQVQLQSEMAELSSTYLPGHPKILSLQSLMDDLEKQIRAEIRKVLKSVEMSAEISGARVLSLQESLNEVMSAAATSDDKGLDLRALEQDARAQRELLETFLTRYRTLAAQSGGLRPAARIISRAEPPGLATSPVRALWAAWGAACGLVFALLLALFSRLAARGNEAEPLEDRDDIADLVRAARRRQQRKADLADVLAQIETEPQAPEPDPRLAAPAAETRAERPADEGVAIITEPQPQLQPQSQLQHQQYEGTIEEPRRSDGPGRASAARIGQWIENAPGTAELGRMLADNPARIVLFAGTGSGHETDQGTDHLALAAAAHAAAAGIACVVLDIGMRPSSVLTPDVRSPGLGHLISGTAPFGEVIRGDPGHGVDVIGMGRALGNPPLNRLTTAIAGLARRYDKVILVADRLEDWPNRHVRPDFAVLVCDPDIDERSRRALYESVLKRGAAKALIVRNEWVSRKPASAAA